MTGPKPIEKRCTSTPMRLATAKWPSSCTNTRTPSAMAKDRTLKANDPTFMIPSPSAARQDGVVVGEDHGKEEAVQPIQDATVARDNPAGIFGAESALQRRLAEVAKLRQDADRRTERDRLAASEHAEEDRMADRGDEHRTAEPAERPLDGLARADRRRELVTPDGATDEIPARVRA